MPTYPRRSVYLDNHTWRLLTRLAGRATDHEGKRVSISEVIRRHTLEHAEREGLLAAQSGPSGNAS